MPQGTAEGPGATGPLHSCSLNRGHGTAGTGPVGTIEVSLIIHWLSVSFSCVRFRAI